MNAWKVRSASTEDSEPAMVHEDRAATTSHGPEVTGRCHLERFERGVTGRSISGHDLDLEWRIGDQVKNFRPRGIGDIAEVGR